MERGNSERMIEQLVVVMMLLVTISDFAGGWAGRAGRQPGWLERARNCWGYSS
jgi:hypothetical protein